MREAGIASAIGVSSASTDRPVHSSGGVSALHRDIEAAISAFGRDVLTAREQAVVQLILRGLSSKVVAGQLRIALKTEKVHRRNAYAKLGVNSHAILFSRFLHFLSVWLREQGDYPDDSLTDAVVDRSLRRPVPGRSPAAPTDERPSPSLHRQAGVGDTGHALREEFLRNDRCR